MPETFMQPETASFSLLHKLPGIYYRCDTDNYATATFFSDGCMSITGYAPGFFVKNKDDGGFVGLMHPDDRPNAIVKRFEALKTTGKSDITYRITTQNGRTKWVNEVATASLGTDGNICMVEGWIQEVNPGLDNLGIDLQTLNAIYTSHSVTKTDAAGKITFANKLFCESSGYSKEELIGRDHRLLKSGYHTKPFYEEMWRTLKSGNIWKGEIKNKNKNGQCVWYDTTISPVRDLDGTISGYISIRSDITGKKLAEEALIAVKKRLRFINDNTPDLLITVDEQFRLTYVNQERSGFSVGYDQEASILDYVAPEFRETYRQHLEQALSGESQEFEMPGYVGDFNLVWYQVRMTSIKADDNAEAVLILSTDITDRKLAEEKTRTSEERFRTLFERNLAGVYRASLDGVILECNNAFAQLIGYENASEVIGRYASELYTNQTDNNFLEDIVAKKGRISSYENRIRRKNGKLVYLLENASMIRDNNGAPGVIEGTVIDITERMEAEKELIVSRERYMMLLNNMNDGFLVDDVHGNVTFANQHYCDIIGYTHEELLQMKITDFVAPEYQSMIIARHNSRIAGEQVSDNFEYEGIRKDGTRICLEMHVSPVIENGVTIGTQSVVQDVTNKKKQEAEYKKLAELNRKIIDSSDEIFYVIDVRNHDFMDNPMVYISEKTVEVSGFTSEQILAHPRLWYSRLHPDDVERVREHTMRLYQSAVPLSVIYRINNILTGEFVWLYDFVKPIHDENGKLVELYGSIKNITELKERESELEKTSLDLNNRYNELMQFNYIVSHNLRSPVANIIGMVNLLRMPEMTDEDRASCFDHIYTAVNRMDYVIKDLNAILETRSALNEKKVMVNLTDLLENITVTLSRQITESETRIDMQIATDANTIFTIKGYMESILYNLISNAIKYKSADRKPVIEITIYKLAENLHISVADNGTGIDLKKFEKHLFGLYKRFHTGVEGKGLGLFMTKTQVETLGGKIRVQSQPDQGSNFMIQLPTGF